MIRPIDIRLNAAHPDYPLAEAVTFTGSPSTVLIRGVPPNCGRWAITAVSVAATFPDGSTTTRAAVQSANGVWVATLPATATSGRTANGIRVMADGIDENGEAVTGYVLGVADFAVASLGVTPAPQPGETSWQMLYFDAVPGTLRKGDVAKVDGVLKLYNGTAWEAFAGDIPAPSTATPATDGTGSAGSSTAYARGDHVHPTDTSRMAASATGADIAVSGTDPTKIDAALAGKVSKSGDTMTGMLTAPSLTVGDRATGSSVGDRSVAEGLGTEASGAFAHAEGLNTKATNRSSHSEGVATNATGSQSHAEGFHTSATNPNEHAEGSYNASHTSNNESSATRHSIGIGTSDNNRKNAVETMGDGKTFIYGIGGYDGTNPTATGTKDLATAVNGKADVSAIPYSLGTPTVIDEASSETVEGETVYYGAATLADRTANVVQVTAATPLDELRITFPAATSGKMRDFGLRVEIGTGSAALAAPALVPVAPTGETIKIENADGTIPALADGTATAKGVTLLYFSETASGVFVVKGEQVEEVA